ncbi:STAS domain-containing protein [Streptomyces sp. NPDC059460]|uniref:STAS domain-containing protein n=1 Tax=Streptomyces sp. NPDC059460 TaxID=3346840 RepID=UPI00368FC66A
MTPITLTTTALNDSTLAVALSGELDIATAGRIEQDLAHLAVGTVRELRLDLSGVTFCDNSGADLFVRVHQHCAATGVRLHLCVCRAFARRCFARLAWMTPSPAPLPHHRSPAAGRH